MMKHFMITILAALLLASALGGCASDSGEEPANTSEPAVETVDVTQIPAESVEATVPKDGLIKEEEEHGLTIGATGSSRVDYAGNISSARYITSADQLPAYSQLQGYDDAYFQEHALLVVMETVNSGGVTVSIESIELEGSKALVRLSHQTAGDVGTTVMTTWLVWAELDAGLDYSWSVKNSAVRDESQRY